VPYSSLQLDKNGSKTVLPGASQDELKKLPEIQIQLSSCHDRKWMTGLQSGEGHAISASSRIR
jgi:hypothetical protein